MILALDKHAALHVFASRQEAESYLEAIDVQQDAFEFCDATGQRYSPNFTRAPKVSPLLGPFALVDIGNFKLVADGGVDLALPERFIGRAAHIEYSSVPAVTNIETLRVELDRQD